MIAKKMGMSAIPDPKQMTSLQCKQRKGLSKLSSLLNIILTFFSVWYGILDPGLPGGGQSLCNSVRFISDEGHALTTKNKKNPKGKQPTGSCWGVGKWQENMADKLDKILVSFENKAKTNPGLLKD